MKKQLIELYLDWVNNYVTLSKMAEDYGMDYIDMDQLIRIGRKLHEANVKALKLQS